MKKCKNCLKYYDENVSKECPYCKIGHAKGEKIFPTNRDEKTVLYTPKESSSEQKTTSETSTIGRDSATIAISNFTNKSSNIEPVVGWLIIVKGEGMGSDLRIVSGMNMLGRGDENKIILDYGDQTISSSHATIIYDYKNNIFFFQHGGGSNLSYINGNVILQPIELKRGDILGIGETELMFLPLCSETFKWDR